ncbi:MAG: hypothetical protein CSA50_06575 [Gammaproteobacteria bacterium]|nr:MAG: hypothetical protein CSA50_06575 [Gammaproteobacteria bacterium]
MFFQSATFIVVNNQTAWPVSIPDAFVYNAPLVNGGLVSVKREKYTTVSQRIFTERALACEYSIIVFGGIV